MSRRLAQRCPMILLIVLALSSAAPGGRPSDLQQPMTAASASGGWITSAPLLTPAQGLAAVTVGGLIYAIGGGDDNSNPIDVVEAYDPNHNSWTTVTALPTARVFLAAAVGADGDIYTFGGKDASGRATNTVEVFDPSTNTWTCSIGDPSTRCSSTQLIAMPTARDKLAAAIGHDGHIYLFGGGDSSSGSYLNIVEAYDPGSKTWTCSGGDSNQHSGGCSANSLPDMPVARDGLAAATGPDGLIYAIGAEDSGVGHETVEAFNLSMNSWTCSTNDSSGGCLTTSLAPMPTARGALAAVTGPDAQIYAIGGDNGHVLNTVEAYDTSRNNWTTAALMPTARDWLAAVTGPDGRIYAIGGQDGNGKATNAVETYATAQVAGTQTAIAQTAAAAQTNAAGQTATAQAVLAGQTTTAQTAAAGQTQTAATQTMAALRTQTAVAQTAAAHSTVPPPTAPPTAASRSTTPPATAPPVGQPTTQPPAGQPTTQGAATTVARQTPVHRKTATGSTSAAHLTATASAARLTATAVALHAGQHRGRTPRPAQASCPAACGTVVTLHNANGHGTLSFTVQVARHVQVSTVLQVSTRQTSGGGRVPHAPAGPGAILYKFNNQGVADNQGRFTAGEYLAYTQRTPLLATLAVSVHLPDRTVQYQNSYIVDPRPDLWYTLPALGPQLLSTVPSPSVPRHPGAADPRFGVANAFQLPKRADDLGIGWERVPIPWNALQPAGSTQWRSDAVGDDRTYDAEIAHGRQLVGVLQGTPAWAARNTRDGAAAVPKNLDLPWNDPYNYWGQFVFHAVRHYAGRIDTFVILNEVNIRSGAYRQFAGTVDDYAQMVRVAYLAAHAANPHVSIHLYGDAVFADQGDWFKRTVAALARLPDARTNNYFFDAAEVHLYDSVLGWDSVVAIWHKAMAAYGFDRPIWLSETNVAPRGDASAPALPTDQNVPLAVQPNFIVSAVAAALGLGIPRIGIYQMLDPSHFGPERPYGLVRRDGSLRPEYAAVKTVTRWFAGVTAARYEPGGQPNADKKPIFHVLMERPGQQIDVLWNQSGHAAEAIVPAVGHSATVVQPDGATHKVVATAGRFRLRLVAATVHSVNDPAVYPVGGVPLIVVQNLPAGRHVAGLSHNDTLFVESTRTAAAGMAIGPVISMAGAPDTVGPLIAAASAQGASVRAIADSAHDRVLITDEAGRTLVTFGTTGGAPGQFRGPLGVAVGADGTLYVGDEGNARIQEFDLAGNLIGGFPIPTRQDALPPAPGALTVAPDGTLYVVDSAADAVLHLSRMGQLLGRWGGRGHGTGQLDGAGGIAADARGHLWVADTLNDRVIEFDGTGHVQAQFISGITAEGGRTITLRWPTGVTVRPDGGIAVADSGSSRIVFAHPQPYLGSIGLAGVQQPAGLAVALDGTYYVSDAAKHRVVHLDANGHVLATLGGSRQLTTPRGLALGPDGNLYVADSGRDRIAVLNLDGHVVRYLGRPGRKGGQFVQPRSVFVAADWTVWVADTGNGRVQHLSQTGAVLGVIANVNGAWGVVADGHGGVYYSEHWGQRVYHVDRDGQRQGWGAPGSGAQEFNNPGTLALAANGQTVYVVDEGNRRVQVIRDGQFAGHRGSTGGDEARLLAPVAVGITPSGAVAVLDAGRRRLALYRDTRDDLVSTTAQSDIPLGVTNASEGVAVALYGTWTGATAQQIITVVAADSAT